MNKRFTTDRIHRKGFTIVELLIVIVIIGILAAIVIVAYNGITTRATDAAVKNNLADIAKKLEIYKASAGSYPTDGTKLSAADIKVSPSYFKQNRNNVYYCSTGASYAIGVEATTGSQYYLTDGTTTTASGVNYGNTCTQAGGGTWGSTGYDWPDDGAGNGWQAWTGQ